MRKVIKEPAKKRSQRHVYVPLRLLALRGGIPVAEFKTKEEYWRPQGRYALAVVVRHQTIEELHRTNKLLAPAAGSA